MVPNQETVINDSRNIITKPHSLLSTLDNAELGELLSYSLSERKTFLTPAELAELTQLDAFTVASEFSMGRLSQVTLYKYIALIAGKPQTAMGRWEAIRRDRIIDSHMVWRRSQPYQKLVTQIMTHPTPAIRRLQSRCEKSKIRGRAQSSLYAILCQILELAGLAAHSQDWQLRARAVVYSFAGSLSLHTIPRATKHPFPEHDDLPLQIKLGLGIAAEMRRLGDRFYCPWTQNYDRDRASMDPAQLLDRVRRQLVDVIGSNPLISCETAERVGTHAHGFIFGIPADELIERMENNGGEWSGKGRGKGKEYQSDYPEYWGYEFSIGWLWYMFEDVRNGSKVNPPDYLINAGKELYEGEIAPFVRSVCIANKQANNTRNRQPTCLNPQSESPREGANKRGNSSRLTQSFHFFSLSRSFLP